MKRDFYREHCEAELRKGFWNPAFSLWRAYEAEAFSSVQLKGPILDLGCGDGTFGCIILPDIRLVGIDLDFETLKVASQLGQNSMLQANATALPFADQCFSGIVSNCAVEHMSDLDQVLSEVHRLLKPEGLFAFTVPSQLYGDYLLTSSILCLMGQRSQAERYIRRKNRRSQHINIHSPAEWGAMLTEQGFRLLRADYILPRRSEWLWEWPHTAFSALQPLIHRALKSSAGRYLYNPLSLASRLTFGRAYRKWRDPQGGNLFLLAQRLDR
jgi:SAM-dependent methyltransferase